MTTRRCRLACGHISFDGVNEQPATAICHFCVDSPRVAITTIDDKLRPGDLVYRVDAPDGDYEWRVYSVEVRSASDRQIILRRGFPFSIGLKFKPSALGRSFFLTPEGAVRDHVLRSHEMIASANRKIIAATRAIAWARLKYGIEEVGRG